MRIMALDVGERRIGVAISDSSLLIAQPRPTMERKNLDSDLLFLSQLAQQNEVHEIVVGKPLHMNGRESRQSEKIARFGRKLSARSGLPVIFRDERLTSVAAEEHLEEMGLNWRKRREQVDKMAALIILQEYLDSLKR
jgi:putative holliday junction resolvase